MIITSEAEFEAALDEVIGLLDAPPAAGTPEDHRFAELLDAIMSVLGPVQPTPSQPAIVAERPSGRGLRVLLAEDNAVNQRVARGLLERRGHSVAVVSTGPAAVAALAAYLLLFQTPFVWWLASPLKLSDGPRQADAIVVFAGGVGESGQAGGGYQERVKRAADLYRSGLAQHVVFSSGYVYAFQEAEIMKGLAVASGIPDAAIVLTCTSPFQKHLFALSGIACIKLISQELMHGLIE